MKQVYQVNLSISGLYAMARRLGINPIIWNERDLVDLVELTLERKKTYRKRVPGIVSIVSTRKEMKSLLRVVK